MSDEKKTDQLPEQARFILESTARLDTSEYAHPKEISLDDDEDADPAPPKKRTSRKGQGRKVSKGRDSRPRKPKRREGGDDAPLEGATIRVSIGFLTDMHLFQSACLLAGGERRSIKSIIEEAAYAGLKSVSPEGYEQWDKILNNK